jgi:protein phosphatase
MKLRSFALTDIGCYRQQNEDSYLCDDGLRLYAVADGIGGLPAGAAASRAAIDSLEGWFVKHATKPFDYATALALANQTVFALGRQLSPRHGIGTTLTLAHFADGAAHVVHVGDSTMFRLRAGELEALTREHNLENEMRDRAARGEPTYALTENRAALTRCVGQPPPLEGDIKAQPVEKFDRYLICTDGITRCITPHELTKHLANAPTPEAAARTLVTLARERGGLDNATAVVIFAE